MPENFRCLMLQKFQHWFSKATKLQQLLAAGAHRIPPGQIGRFSCISSLDSLDILLSFSALRSVLSGNSLKMGQWRLHTIESHHTYADGYQNGMPLLSIVRGFRLHSLMCFVGSRVHKHQELATIEPCILYIYMYNIYIYNSYLQYILCIIYIHI